MAWSDVAQYQVDRGLDPSPAVGKAVSSLERAIGVNPQRPNTYNNLGNANLILAEYHLARGTDARPALARAADSFQKAVDRFPEYTYGTYNLAYTHRTLAEALLAQEGDPRPSLQTAERYLNESFRLNPDDADNYLERARLRMAAARWEIRRGDPSAPLREAEAALRQAEALNPGAPEIYLAQALLHRARAEWTLAHGGRPDAEIHAGLERAGKALAIHPGEPKALALQGLFHHLAARLETDPVRRRDRLGQAIAALRKALAANPLLEREYGPVLHQAEQEAGA